MMSRGPIESFLVGPRAALHWPQFFQAVADERRCHRPRTGKSEYELQNKSGYTLLFDLALLATAAISAQAWREKLIAATQKSNVAVFSTAFSEG
jgi:hypothetical protein